MAVRVLEVLDDGMARVNAGRRFDEVDIGLVDAAAGDIVLVHAKVAIAKLLQTP